MSYESISTFHCNERDESNELKHFDFWFQMGENIFTLIFSSSSSIVIQYKFWTHLFTRIVNNPKKKNLIC